MKTRSLLSAVLAAALIVPAVAPAQQKYPVKSVRVVLPFAAGSAVDLLGRLYAQRMSESWGQQVVVDSFAALLGSEEQNRVADAVECYRERFSTKGPFENAVYQGIPEAQAGVVANTDREKMPLNFGPQHDAVIG